MLAQVAARPRRPAARRAARGPARAERRGDRLLGRAARRRRACSPRPGAREIAPGAAAELYARTWADASLDVNGIESGDAVQRRTIIPCTASARLSVRVALGQDGAAIAAALERILREAAPAGAEVELDVDARRAGRLRRRPIRCSRSAREAIGRAAGTQPLFVRTRRLDPDPRRARRSAASRRCCRASRSTPTASTGPTRATGSRASPSASGPRASSTRRSRRSA